MVHRSDRHLVVALVFEDHNGDNNRNDDKKDDEDSEADPTLLTRGPCRVHGLVRVVQARAKARLV